jgi:hypothetical protein
MSYLFIIVIEATLTREHNKFISGLGKLIRETGLKKDEG